MNETFVLDGQLLKWARTSNGGMTVTLQCADPDAAQAYFEPKTTKKGNQAGQLFEIEFRELDDFGNAPQTPQRFAGGAIAKWLIWDAGKDASFWEFLGVENEVAAGAKVKQLIGCESRKQIDGNKALEDSFHHHVRWPYQQWLAERVK